MKQVARLIGYWFVFTFAFVGALEAHFERSKEFPNLILQRAYHQVSPEAIPEKEIDRAELALNRLLYSFLNRAVMPIVLPGQKVPQMTRIFPYLQGLLDQQRSQAVMRPLVRSILGGIYEQLKGIYDVNPATYDAVQASEQLIREERTYPVTELWGVGSDFDVLLSGVDDKRYDPSESLTRVVNSVRELYNIGFSKDPINRSLYPLADFKTYNKQIERSSVQGGSTIDFVAYDMKERRLIDPPRFPGTVRNLVRGLRRYVRPQQGVIVDLSLQTIRTSRPTLELPWLRLDSESEKLLVLDLGKTSHASGVAFEQFNKLMRNSRFGASNNAVYRSEEGSAEAALLALSKRMNLPISEYLEHYPIPPQGRSTNGLPKDILMTTEEFVSLLADGKYLFHGTKTKSNFMAILRGNFVASAGNGKNPHRGTYTSPNVGIAHHYSNGTGHVVKIRPRLGQKLNIVRAERLKQTPLYKELMKGREEESEDVYQLLAREYGIDIIVISSDYILLENSAAIEILGVKDLLPDIGRSLIDKQISIEKRIDAFERFRILIEYANSIGMNDEETKAEVAYLMDAFVLALVDNVQQGSFLAAKTLKELRPTNREVLLVLAGYLSKPELATVASVALSGLASQDAQILDSVIGAMKNLGAAKKENIVEGLMVCGSTDTKVLATIADTAKNFKRQMYTNNYSERIDRIGHYIAKMPVQLPEQMPVIEALSAAFNFEPARARVLAMTEHLNTTCLINIAKILGSPDSLGAYQARILLRERGALDPIVREELGRQIERLQEAGKVAKVRPQNPYQRDAIARDLRDLVGLKAHYASDDDYTYKVGNILSKLQLGPPYNHILKDLTIANSRDPVVIAGLIHASTLRSVSENAEVVDVMLSSGSKDPNLVSGILAYATDESDRSAIPVAMKEQLKAYVRQLQTDHQRIIGQIIFGIYADYLRETSVQWLETKVSSIGRENLLTLVNMMKPTGSVFGSASRAAAKKILLSIDSPDPEVVEALRKLSDSGSGDAIEVLAAIGNRGPKKSVSAEVGFYGRRDPIVELTSADHQDAAKIEALVAAANKSGHFEQINAIEQLLKSRSNERDVQLAIVKFARVNNHFSSSLIERFRPRLIDYIKSIQTEDEAVLTQLAQGLETYIGEYALVTLTKNFAHLRAPQYHEILEILFGHSLESRLMAKKFIDASLPDDPAFIREFEEKLKIFAQYSRGDVALRIPKYWLANAANLNRCTLLFR